MPKFFFHVRDDMDVPAEEGAELPDVETARDYAARSARVLMCETLKESGRIHLDHRIDVENDDGAVLSTVSFGDAVSIEE